MGATWQPLRFVSQAYEARSRFSAQHRLVNMYAEAAPPGGKGNPALYQTPGMTSFATTGDGPCRGMIVMGANVFVVSGEELYSVNSLGTATLIGAIPGVAHCQLAENGTHVAIATEGSLYVANASTVTEMPYTGFSGATYQDGYGIFTKRGTQQVYITGLDDMTSIAALDFTTADVLSDNVVGCISDHRELWVFKERSTEILYNSGASSFPFVRVSSGFLERGCISPASIAKIDHRVIWLGDDRAVYASQGYQPQRISTQGVEGIIGDDASPTTALGMTYTQGGHTFYALTLDSVTLVFDFVTGLWHERESYGYTQWRARGHSSAFGRELVGDVGGGNIYSLDLETYDENSTTPLRTITIETLQGGGRRAIMDEFFLDCEVGVGLVSGSGSDPIVNLEYSDDGGSTWSTPLVGSIGQIGQYNTRCKWHRLGSFYDRTLRVTMREPVKFAVLGAAARVDVQQ